MKSYWSQEVAKILDISTSTLRRWSTALEKEGYPFIRDENDKRAYLERDIVPLSKMRELLADEMGMESAAKAVVFRFSEQVIESRAVTAHQHDARSLECLYERIERIEQSLQTQQEEVLAAVKQISTQVRDVSEQVQTTEENLHVLLSRVDTYGKRNRWWNFWR